MKVQLREIPCRKPVVLGASFIESALAGLPMREVLERPPGDPAAGAAAGELELGLEGRNVFVRGHLDGHMEIGCSRCLGLVRQPLDEDVAVTFLPRAEVPDDDHAGSGGAAGEPVDGEEPAEFEEDDVDVYPYDGEEVDLEPMLRERIVLAMPFAPLCKDDCKGLCLKCGADLNQGECGCDRRVIDPRLASLKDLKV